MWGCVYRNLIGLVRGEDTEGVIIAVGTFAIDFFFWYFADRPS